MWNTGEEPVQGSIFFLFLPDPISQFSNDQSINYRGPVDGYLVRISGRTVGKMSEKAIYPIDFEVLPVLLCSQFSQNGKISNHNYRP
jgi:hypothetical protein